MTGLQEFGIDLIVWLQQMSPALDGVMEFFTFLGTVEAYMLLIPLLYWAVNKRWAFRAFLVLLFTDIITTSFKLLLHQPRPYWVSPEVRLLSGPEPSYGLPSGHSSDPLAVLGYLSAQIRKRWMWWVTAAVVLMIGISRVYLGVHFPHDVLAGWLVGTVVLVLILRSEGRVGTWLDRQSFGAQLSAALLASLVFIALGVLISAAITASPDDPAWAQHSLEARSLNQFITLGASLFGSAAGYGLMKQHAPFRVQGTLGQKIARYLLGIVGTIVILYGLDYLFDLFAGSALLDYLLRYVRYSLTTLWVMFGAPWLFLRLRLAETE